MIFGTGSISADPETQDVPLVPKWLKFILVLHVGSPLANDYFCIIGVCCSNVEATYVPGSLNRTNFGKSLRIDTAPIKIF